MWEKKNGQQLAFSDTDAERAMDIIKGNEKKEQS